MPARPSAAAEHPPPRHPAWKHAAHPRDAAEHPSVRHAAMPSRTLSPDVRSRRPRQSARKHSAHSPDVVEHPSARPGRSPFAAESAGATGNPASRWSLRASRVPRPGAAGQVVTPPVAEAPCRAVVCPGSGQRAPGAGGPPVSGAGHRRGGVSGSGRKPPPPAGKRSGGRSRRTCEAAVACPRRPGPAGPPRCRASAASRRERATAAAPWRRCPRRWSPGPARSAPGRACFRARVGRSRDRVCGRSLRRRRSRAVAGQQGSRTARRRRVPTELPCPRARRTPLVRPLPKAARVAPTGVEGWRRAALPYSCTPRFLAPPRATARRRNSSEPVPCLRARHSTG